MTFTWSPSAIISARTCLQQWYLTYGSGRRPELNDKHLVPRNIALGLAMHSALQAAYECARREFPGSRHQGTMDHYLGQAAEMLASRWRNLLLPDDNALQIQLVSELCQVLESQRVPHPAAVLAVEETIRFTGRSGTPFKATLDLALRTGRDSIHIRDWKHKSRSSLPKAAELLDDVQLCEQRVAAAERWPWARTVTVGLFSTVTCAEVQAELPLERALYLLDGHEVTAHRAETAEVFPANKGGACGSCRVRPQCPAFATRTLS